MHGESKHFRYFGIGFVIEKGEDLWLIPWLRHTMQMQIIVESVKRKMSRIEIQWTLKKNNL